MISYDIHAVEAESSPLDPIAPSFLPHHPARVIPPGLSKGSRPTCMAQELCRDEVPLSVWELSSQLSFKKMEGMESKGE
jgi:hypothetical protein